VSLSDELPPTDAQLREVRALRQRDQIPLSNLPKTRDAAVREIAKYRGGSGDGFQIWGTGISRPKVGTEKKYAATRP
jgi:hypothetical protein